MQYIFICDDGQANDFIIITTLFKNEQHNIYRIMACLFSYITYYMHFLFFLFLSKQNSLCFLMVSQTNNTLIYIGVMLYSNFMTLHALSFPTLFCFLLILLLLLLKLLFNNKQ